MRDEQLRALKIGKRGTWRVSRAALEEYLEDLDTEARARREAREAAER
jgi:hypothetical protein